MKKILLITPTSTQVIIFREKLIEQLQKEKYSVAVLTLDDKAREEIEGRGIDFHCIHDANRSLNPFKILSLTKRYAKAIKEINPDIVFTFMLKPNTFGVLGAKKAGVKDVLSMVEGAGDPFIYDTFKWKIIRLVVSYLYKRSLKHSRKVFFINSDDRDEFVARKLVKAEQCEVIHGIGVDIERFNYRPIKKDRTFLMIARMLETKGVYEYCECARRVKKIYPDAVFNYVGPEGTVTLDDIREYIDDGSISYLGATKDVRPYIEDATAHILPSYREGFGLVNAEAGAIGRLSITYQTNGTRDTVIDNETGFIVPLRSVDGLVDKVVWCIEHPAEVSTMGKKAREFTENNFDKKVINQKIMSVIANE